MQIRLKIVTVIVVLIAMCANLAAQTSNVTGTVKDESGVPVAGATVMIKGTAIGTDTDVNGNYSIKSPSSSEGYILEYHFIGLTTVEVKVTTQRVVNVVMKEDNSLKEAVIVGAYGTKQTREDLVGSAFQVTGEALKDKPKARLDNLLEGLVPGLTLEAANQGDATSTRDRFNVRVRGDGSLSASKSPLWVIDGIPAYTGNTTGVMAGMTYSISPLSFMDPNDIESITVLKDADQTTIYGANGANGVILVTTKSGKYNEPLSVNVTLNYGVSMPDYSTRFKMMNASQYMEVAKEAWVNSGYDIKNFPYQDNDYNTYSTTSTDWAKEYLGIGSDTYASITLTHGTSRARSYISGSYYKNDNIVQKDRQQRFYIRMNESIQPWKSAQLSLSLAATYNDNDIFPLSKAYLDALPITSPYLNDGVSYRLYNKVWSEAQNGFVLQKFFDNEVPDRELNELNDKSVKTMFNADFSWEIIKNLEFKAAFGYNYLTNFERSYSSRETLDGMSSEGEKRGYSSRRSSSYPDWSTNETLRYSHDFGKHHIGAYVGMEFKSSGYRYVTGSGSGFMNDHIQEISFADKASLSASSGVKTTRGESFFGRAEYSYGKRYYLSGNVRRDGNSAFGRYSRWANFWSLGASWNIHKEKFFHSDIIKMLKLKATFGCAGNSFVDTSSSKGTYNYSASYSYQGVSGSVLGAVPNPGLSWETKYMLNLGLRVEIGNFLDAELELYQNDTKDLISSIYVSRAISDSKVPANVGRLRNKGAELNITSTNIHNGDFSWTTSFNISHNQNKILELYQGMTTSYITSIWMEGKDSNTYALVRWAGVDPTDGSPLWYDKNGNITRTYNYDDRVFDKSSTPICYGGLINTFTYGPFSASFQINYNIGGWDLATYASNFYNDGYGIISGNQAVEEYYYRWTTPGQSAKLPKVQQTSQGSTYSSTRYLYDKTYFNLSNASLSYKLPERFVSKIHLKDASVSLVGNNLYLFTPDQSRKFNSYKTVRNGYPVTRIISLSLNASF